MRGLRVKPRQIFSTLFRNNRGLVIVMPRSLADGIDRVPQHDGDELDLDAKFSPQQIAASIALLLTNAREQLRLQHCFISVRVFGSGVSMPHSRDHVYLLSSIS